MTRPQEIRPLLLENHSHIHIPSSPQYPPHTLPTNLQEAQLAQHSTAANPYSSTSVPQRLCEQGQYGISAAQVLFVTKDVHVEGHEDSMVSSTSRSSEQNDDILTTNTASTSTPVCNSALELRPRDDTKTMSIPVSSHLATHLTKPFVAAEANIDNLKTPPTNSMESRKSSSRQTQYYTEAETTVLLHEYETDGQQHETTTSTGNIHADTEADTEADTDTDTDTDTNTATATMHLCSTSPREVQRFDDRRHQQHQHHLHCAPYQRPNCMLSSQTVKAKTEENIQIRKIDDKTNRSDSDSDLSFCHLSHIPTHVYSTASSSTPLSPSPLLPPPLSSPSRSFIPTNDEDPSNRFEILERLGFGRAIDEDVDYFVSWIVDHCCEAARDTQGASSNGIKDECCIEDDYIGAASGLQQIVKCLGCYRNDTELWLSLEFCAGGSVADLIRLSDSPLTEPEIGWVMSQILLGLAYLHSRDHVHGDIKAGNILLTFDGNVKLGGSGSIMNHKVGAGERKRRRRSLTMLEFPANWLAPESNPDHPMSPSSIMTSPYASPTTSTAPTSPMSPGSQGFDGMSRRTPEASTAMDIWALGVACIELSQGRPPRSDAAMLASFGRQCRPQASPIPLSWEAAAAQAVGWGQLQTDSASGSEGADMSEDMREFVAKCLTPDPEERLTVHELLKDPFIEKYNTKSQDLLSRIQRMVEFVDQCTFITLECQEDSSSLSSPTLTLSPSKASHMVDNSMMKQHEEEIGFWLIPPARARVDSVYDASSYFDEAGLPMPVPPSPTTSNTSSPSSPWKHQRISHPMVRQALMREQARYVIFRHSRTPSLATIAEDYQRHRSLSLPVVAAADDDDNNDDDNDDDDDDDAA
ncbi:hypothetical protein BG011_000035 [Mortierella polycephala]|uniref:Protein kinase domain-containing protein n=1 Tax=Mortierella polycephala TaxID=41804 RepID=A0A9P6QG66_9FUNG|nr:hypothetical protein BG011_000035 [Mortierella polycephala]